MNIYNKILSKFFIALAASVLIALPVCYLFDNAMQAFAVAILLLILLVSLLFRGIFESTRIKVEALDHALQNLLDGDFSVSLVEEQKDEIDQLFRRYNQLSDKLRSERQRLYQRELMLDTVIENADLALLLLDSNKRIIYANMQAAHMLNAGASIVGRAYPDFQARWPKELCRLIDSESSGILSLEIDNQLERYHVNIGKFNFQATSHLLILIKSLTRELRRQEVSVWKSVIRVISHELNNSLAPISSMAHSAKIASEKGELKSLEKALTTIAERSRHLSEFVGSYARLAKLPAPAMAEVSIDTFLDSIHSMIEFSQSELPSDLKATFDMAQMQQVLLNLLKNAHESGSKPSEISVHIYREINKINIEVWDRGSGMSEDVLAQAMLPFYTTKKEGSGVGLSLCREIIEQHNGRITYENRPEGGLKVRIQLPTKPQVRD